MSSDTKQSIITSIPTDSLNIIKEFLAEERVLCPLKLKCYVSDFFITKYKDGYKIDRTFNSKRFEEDNKGMTNEESKNKKRDIFKKKIAKYYPIFIDDKEDVINYMYNHWYSNFAASDTDSEYDDPTETYYVRIRLGGCHDCCYVKDFKGIMRLYMELIGKVYKKV